MATAETKKEVATVPAFVAPAALYGNNIKKEVETALLLLSEVQVVEDEASKIKLDNAVKNAKKVRKAGGELRLDQTRKIDAFKALFTDREKEFFSDLDKNVTGAEAKINAWNKKLLDEARAKAEAIRLEGEKEAARKRTPTSVAAVEVKTQAKLAEVELPAGVKMAWAWEIKTLADIKLIPAEFLQNAIIAFAENKGELPDVLRLALNEFVRAGGRSMPGVNIVEKPVRTGR